MKDGPKPMRNMRHAKRNRNGADKFREEHEVAYESRATAERTRDVDAHNAAYPQMRDELKRRRSTAEANIPSTNAKRRRITKDILCPLCQKTKAESKMKSKSKRIDSRKRRLTKQRTKRRERSTLKLAKIDNYGISYRPMTMGADGETLDEERKSDSMSGSQGSKSVVIYPASVTSFWSNSKSNLSVLMMSRGCQSYRFPSTSKQAECQELQTNLDSPATPKGSKSDVISRNPDTSENTLSSYNSNLSLDHEPMLSP